MPDASNAKAAAPYVLRAGEGRCLNVAGQLIYMLAGEADTAGGFSATVCEATLDRGPIPKHYHERAHDTWFCTRGKLRIWFNDECRTLTDGDFAYVPAGDVHSYQSVAPRTQFFGIVAPGGWEQFFVAAGEEWSRPCLPALNHPFDFSRMRPAMMAHDVHPVPDPKYPESVDASHADREAPTSAASYVLRSGYGVRRRLNGHLSTSLLSHGVTGGLADMRTIEGGRDAAMPRLRHSQTHVLIYMLEGVLRLELDGKDYLLGRGDTANIPAGVAYTTRIESAQARWVLCSANGDGLAFWEEAGAEAGDFIYDDAVDTTRCASAIRALRERDVAVV